MATKKATRMSPPPWMGSKEEKGEMMGKGKQAGKGKGGQKMPPKGKKGC